MRKWQHVLYGNSFFILKSTTTWEFTVLLLQTHFDAYKAEYFWKHCDKMRNCSKRAIFPFITKFWTFFSNYSFSNRDFPYFWVDIFKVVCGKGLTVLLLQTRFDASAADVFWKHCDKRRNCSRRAISPFATKFSTICSNYSYINRDFFLFLSRHFQSSAA